MPNRFQCQGPLNGVAVPVGWDEMDLFARSRFVRAQGLAENHLDAYEILRAAGLIARPDQVELDTHFVSSRVTRDSLMAIPDAPDLSGYWWNQD